MASSTPLTALVVDDHPENLGVLLDVLSRAGFRVLVAEDGEAALETCECVRLDVIFLDVSLPGIDGFETCRRLLANPRVKDVPVLFVTAHDQTADRLRAFAAGGVDYVTKPFRADELLSRARVYATMTSLRRRMRLAHQLLEQSDIAGALALLTD